jgi:hypothetical protein
MKISRIADLIGISVSFGCAVHCAILPVFLSGLSVFGINIIHNFWFESGMILLAFTVGTFSLLHGFIRHHRSLTPLLLFSAGMVFLLAKHFWQLYELILLLFAVILIISAHFFNFRYTRTVTEKSKN